MESATTWYADLLLRDRLYILSIEYSVPVDALINLAIKRLLDDVELIRSLRAGSYSPSK